MATLIVCNHAIRFHDNPLLKRAGNSPVFLFVLDPNLLFEQVDQWSQARTHFLIQGLTEFSHRLNALGYVLNVAIGEWADQVKQYAEATGATDIVCATPIGWREQQAFNTLVDSVNTHVTSLNCSELFESRDIHGLFTEIPDIFSSFRRQVEKSNLVVSACTQAALQPAVLAQTPTRSTLESGITWLKDRMQKQPSTYWQRGSESAGLDRIDQYICQTQSIRDYKNTRNGLSGRFFSTQFSPWLATGAVSARWIWQMVNQHEQQFGANDSTYWVKFELLWREFFHWQQKQHGRAWFSRYGIQGKLSFELPTLNTTQQHYLSQWQKGETGHDFIDANMRMLRLTGWMSNRGRQNVASFLIHELALDWRLGASWFESQLVDYDVASNWGNWAYLAGVGNDPRGSRRFNIAKQAQTHDPTGEFVHEWLSERGK